MQYNHFEFIFQNIAIYYLINVNVIDMVLGPANITNRQR